MSISDGWTSVIRDDLLSSVEKPGRYIGAEWNSVRKDPARVRVKVALAFPDTYEIGMSYIGQKILYSLINAQPEWAAERVFAPWPDYEQRLRESGYPLSSLENAIPLADFDILGFSLLYELNDSNVLTILDLGGVPLLARKRGGTHPLVIAGGPAAFNPEPLADIFDLFLVGDGEEAVPEILSRFDELKRRKASRDAVLSDLAAVPGVYVPSLYAPYQPAGSPLLAVRPTAGMPATVRKRVLQPFATSHFPADIVVPNIQAVFDRVAVEVARGCPQKCRFCQAVNLYAPFRVKDPSFVRDTIFESVRSTGYEDASLFSLSVSDYPYLEDTLGAVMDGLENERVALSLSALRPRGLSANVARHIVKVRKTGFTLVPEAGSERLRRVINKNVTDRELFDAAANAFREGWKLVKLYFMIGLPTETEADLEAIVSLVETLSEIGRTILGTPPRIHMSVSSFIPKPHTPFQWLAMDEERSLLEKQAFLRRRLKRRRNVVVKDHPVKASVLEAVFSRGDRRLGPVLIQAWTNGARFDGWGDQARPTAWRDAFAACGVEDHVYLGVLDRDAVLPWDHIDPGVRKSFLREELDKALRDETTPSCLETACGVCRGCDYAAIFRRTFGEKIGPQTPFRKLLGRATETVRRYQVRYEKNGPARFLSHNDLLNVLHRLFKRAGVDVRFSEGFHPKMQMSFPPALALGLVGRDESFEFKSCSEMDEPEFLEAVNSRAPVGIKFFGLDKIEPGAPSITERIDAYVFSLDLRAERVRQAIGRLRQDKALAGDDVEIAERIVERYRPERSAGLDDISIDRDGRKVMIRLRSDPSHAVRPQDIIERLFGLSGAVYAMAREAVIFKN